VVQEALRALATTHRSKAIPRALRYVVVTNFPPPRREGIVVWCVSSYPETP